MRKRNIAEHLLGQTLGPREDQERPHPHPPAAVTGVGSGAHFKCYDSRRDPTLEDPGHTGGRAELDQEEGECGQGSGGECGGIQARRGCCVQATSKEEVLGSRVVYGGWKGLAWLPGRRGTQDDDAGGQAEREERTGWRKPRLPGVRVSPGKWGSPRSVRALSGAAAERIQDPSELGSQVEVTGRGILS